MKCSTGFHDGFKSPYKNMHIEGIESIETMDIDYATELGYKIKHIALAKRTNSQIRKLRGTTTMSKQDGKIVKSYMPYSLRG